MVGSPIRDTKSSLPPIDHHKREQGSFHKNRFITIICGKIGQLIKMEDQHQTLRMYQGRSDASFVEKGLKEKNDHHIKKQILLFLSE